MLLPLESLFSLHAIVLVSISLCSGQIQDEAVTLTSQCVSEDGDFQLTCTVQNVAHLFWFFNGNNTRHYEYFRGSEDEQCPCDPSMDSMLPSVQVTVQEAMGADRFDAVSLLSASLLSLLALNIHSVECGSANTRSQSVIINPDIRCAAMLSLTSQPETSGRFCPGPVTFTCVGTEVDSSVSWLVNSSSVVTYEYQSNDTYPLDLSVDPPLDGVMAIVSSASTNPSVTNRFNVISTLSVSDVTILNKTALRCQDASGDTSETIDIQIGLLDSPPSVNFTSCSLLPSSEGAIISLQWSPFFTSQYAVERYRMSVNPDPSSCSSDQVSPSEDYSCFGLVLGTHYTFTVSAINCGDQEGERNEFNAYIGELVAVGVVEIVAEQNVVKWSQSSYVSEGCLPVGDIEYIVELVDNTGEVVEQRVVTSDNCSNGTCSILIPPGTCRVGVQATSPFGNSMTEVLNIAGVRLTTTNQALIVAGVILLSVAVVIVIILIIMTVLKRGSQFSFVLLLVGCVLVVLSFVLWIAVACQVGLQENTCDPGWQSTRDALIIAAHVISDLAFLVEVVTAGLVCIAICCRDYCISKSASNKKAHKYVFKWLSPTQARTGPTNNQKETVEIAMELHKKHGQPGFQRGAGGRVTDLEAEGIIVDEFKRRGERARARAREEVFQKYDPKLKEQEELHKKRGQPGFQRGAGGRVTDLEAEGITVDEFKRPGERAPAGALRAREEIFQKYDSKLKEQEEQKQAGHKLKEQEQADPKLKKQEADRELKEQEQDDRNLMKQEAAQYDTTTHVKTPASATPTQTSTQPAKYSVLDRLKEKVTGGRGGGEYQQLDHKGKGGAKVDNRKHLPPSEEYGTLETETPPGPPPGGVRKSTEVGDSSRGQDKEKSPSAPKKPARSPAAQPNTSSNKGTGSASRSGSKTATSGSKGTGSATVPGSKAPAAQPNTSSSKGTGSAAVAAPGTNGNRTPDTVDGDGDHKARSKKIKKDYDTLAKKFQPGKLNMILDEEHRGEDTHLVRIAETFEENWDTTMAPALGLTAEEINTIKRKYRNKAEQKRQALKVWKDREAKKATYGNLLRRLVTCENKSYASSLPDLWSSSV